MTDQLMPISDTVIDQVYGADDQHIATDFFRRLCNQAKEANRLRAAINTPEIHDFIKAVQLEAIHQRERWGTEHDEGKSPEDWLWLIAYLGTKAAQAHRYGDSNKYLHHIVTVAAACLNWHANASGTNTRMRPGAT